MQLPPLPEQRAIARILGALDDKIELNRKMNQTLEALAATLFRAWFVDFEPVRAKLAGRPPAGIDAATAALFPDRLVASALGEIPAGWQVGRLTDLIEFNPRYPLPRDSGAVYVEMASLPTNAARVSRWIRRTPGSGTRFKNGDVLLARITPCLENGKTAIVDFLSDDEVGWGSTEFIVMKPNPRVGQPWLYCLARYEPFRQTAIQAMTGTSGRQRVPVDAVGRYPVVLAPQSIHERFQELVAPFFERMRVADAESAILAELRDTLLPRLLSGELRVPEELLAE